MGVGDSISDEQFAEIETISKLIQKLSSSDKDAVEEACKDTDAFLKAKCDSNNGFTKVVVNKCSESACKNDDNAKSDIETFMMAATHDAQERAKRRARQRNRALKIKERANAFFKAGDWKRSTELYNQAIEIAKDWDILYTNRAQAYLRSGQPELALKDCDTVLLFYPTTPEQVLEQSSVTDKSGVLNRIAKAHLHRGKALIALNQPQAALDAYALSRSYSEFKSINRDHNNQCEQRDKDNWPKYLIEYVEQAQAALIAYQEDAKTEAHFKESLVDTQDGCISRNLMKLLTQLVKDNETPEYYSAVLRQLTRLFVNAPRHSSECTQQPRSLTELQVSDSNANLSDKASYSSHYLNGKSEDTGLLSTVVTYSDLQTIFRCKSGFIILEREVKAVYQSMGITNNSVGTNCPPFVRPDNTGDNNYQTGSNYLPTADRLLSLIQLADQLIVDCAENQRILIDSQPDLIKLILLCMELPVDFVQHFVKSTQTDQNKIHKQRQCHTLGALRTAACNILASLTSLPSGRQSLLNTQDVRSLLNALACCLTSCLCPNEYKTGASKLTNGLSKLTNGLQGLNYTPYTTATTTTINGQQTQPDLLISCMHASVCAAKSAQVLENLSESSRFLTLIGSTRDCLDALLTVIESSLVVSKPSTLGSGLTGTNVDCLASLIDSLAIACRDFHFQKSVLQSNKMLLIALTDCLTRHAPLLKDISHARLVSSICCLVHNFYVVQTKQTQDDKISSDNFLTSNKLVNAILTGVGIILDQPGHGPELRAVAVALAGRLLSFSQSNIVLSWFGENKVQSLSGTNLTDRMRLLLAVLDSCSSDSVGDNHTMSNYNNANEKPQKTTDMQTGQLKDQQIVSSHLLEGCIRCLAAGVAHSTNLRYAIGDDRSRVKRLARLIRLRQSNDNEASSNTCNAYSKKSIPRNESLAGNVCLVLQHCTSDTPLAEHLQGTSVIYDLLSLIQDCKRVDAKRNAAILVGKLAQSSQPHRDELSRLDGFSVLKSFSSWSEILGCY